MSGKDSLLGKEPTKKAKESLMNKSFSNVGISRYRWLFLIPCGLGQFSYYWVVSLLSSLQTQIQDDLNVDAAKYGFLQTCGLLGSWVMPLLMGYLIDLFGARFGYIYGNLVVVIGLVVQGITGTYNSFWGMCVGNFIISFGMDSINLSNYKLMCKWFKSKDLGLAFALAGNLQSLAGIANGYITPTLYNVTNELGFPLFIAALVGGFSYICAHISCEMDLQRENQLNQLTSTKEFTETIKLKDLTKFRLLYWLFVGPFIVIQALLIPMQYYNSEYMQQRYKFDTQLAGLFSQFQNFTPMVLGPILGIIMDRCGRIGELMIIASVLSILGCILQGVLPNCDKCLIPLLPIGLQGFTGAITGLGIMVGLARIVDVKMLGISFGVALWVMEVIQAFFPSIDGAIVDATSKVENGYYWVFIVNGFINIIGLAAGIATVIYDYKTGNRLGVPQKKETKEDDEKLIEEARKSKGVPEVDAPKVDDA